MRLKRRVEKLERKVDDIDRLIKFHTRSRSPLDPSASIDQTLPKPQIMEFYGGQAQKVAVLVTYQFSYHDWCKLKNLPVWHQLEETISSL